ncbi:MAG: hypothetical protein ACI857_002771 [Arenicella sp.]|jgi:hypothetical protein
MKRISFSEIGVLIVLIYPAFLILALSVSSCSTSQNLENSSLAGVYRPSIGLFYLRQLELNEDSTFVMSASINYELSIATGKWNHIGDFLILSCTPQSELDTSLLSLEKNEIGQGFISISALNSENGPISNMVCQLKKNGVIIAERTTDSNGYVELEQYNSDTLIIKHNNREFHYQIKNSNIDFYKFEFNEEANWNQLKLYFTEYKIHKNTLFRMDEEGERMRKDYFTKK